MGAFLEVPNKEKNSEPGKNDHFYWGACGMQGWRKDMEDTHICEAVDIQGSYGMLFGVFDGHGGRETAEYAKKYFKQRFVANAKFKEGDYENALKQTFLALDDEIKGQEDTTDTGCTACVVFITKSQIYCANAGDSRAIICQGGDKAIPLSFDHKPNNQEELKRIQEAGHSVMMDRVDGELALSRAFGDHQFKDNDELPPEKQAVTADPDITKRDRNKDDDYVIVACDGIWDCVSNEQCVQKINEYINKLNPKPENLCPVIEQLFDEICAESTLDPGGTDNMTAIIIKFNQK